MQIIRHRETLAVSYMLPDGAAVQLDADGLQAPGIHALDVTAATHELLQSIPAPAVWAGSALAWDAGWVVLDQAAIDAALAAQAAARQHARAALATAIDEAVAAIYSRFTRFQLEYTEREAQAQAYKDAGYTGPVPPRVDEFATPAGMPAKAATDLILQQAVNLRTAQGELSALRMRKYEVLRAATDEQAQAVAAEILAGVAAVGANVS